MTTAQNKIADAKMRVSQLRRHHEQRLGDLRFHLDRMETRYLVLKRRMEDCLAQSADPNSDPRVHALLVAWHTAQDAEQARCTEYRYAPDAIRTKPGFHEQYRDDAQRLRAASMAALAKYDAAFTELLTRYHTEQLAAQAATKAEAEELYGQMATVREEIAQLEFYLKQACQLAEQAAAAAAAQVEADALSRLPPAG